MLGQMQIRSKIVNPRKAKSMDDYKDALTEWDGNINKLQAYGGELPHQMDILHAYQKLLDDNPRAFAIEKVPEASAAGEYTGDDPKEFLADLRRKVESRIAQWQSMGPRAPIA